MRMDFRQFSQLFVLLRLLMGGIWRSLGVRIVCDVGCVRRLNLMPIVVETPHAGYFLSSGGCHAVRSQTSQASDGPMVVIGYLYRLFMHASKIGKGLFIWLVALNGK